LSQVWPEIPPCKNTIKIAAENSLYILLNDFICLFSIAES
jgi:hypothetical protein